MGANQRYLIINNLVPRTCQVASLPPAPFLPNLPNSFPTPLFGSSFGSNEACAPDAGGLASPAGFELDPDAPAPAPAPDAEPELMGTLAGMTGGEAHGLLAEAGRAGSRRSSSSMRLLER